MKFNRWLDDHKVWSGVLSGVLGLGLYLTAVTLEAIFPTLTVIRILAVLGVAFALVIPFLPMDHLTKSQRQVIKLISFFMMAACAVMLK